jgi:hypothetical protein
MNEKLLAFSRGLSRHLQIPNHPDTPVTGVKVVNSKIP